MGTGEDLLGIPGGFATDPAFTISTTTPTPSKYFVTVTRDNVLWTSAVFTIVNGLSEIVVDGWTCESLVDTCSAVLEIPEEQFDVDQNNHNHLTTSVCIWLCASTPKYLLDVYDVPLTGDPFFYATLSSGCGPNTACNSDIESPAAVPYWENGTTTLVFIWVDVKSQSPIYTEVDGWACLYIDLVLPVEQGSFDAVAADRSVKLTWNTLSETNLDGFNVMRKLGNDSEFELIASVQAENSPSGANYDYVDHEVANGTSYTYTLFTVNRDGSTQNWGSEVTATPNASAAVITEYALHQNYPNPFNSVTNFVFDVVEQNPVSLKIFNVNGELVAQPVDGFYSVGRHTISYDANTLATGLYFYRLTIGNTFVATRKMLLVK